MRHRGKLRAAALAVSIGAGALLVMPSAGAVASTRMSLPITSFYQIVADTAHGHLFISEGSSSINHILVTDLTGKQVATIDSQNGVMGIALSPDGTTLYAALSANHAVTAIDTSTLLQTASYPIGNTNTPQDVAVQSGKIWVSYSTATPAAAAIGDIDLSAKMPAFQAQPTLGTSYYYAPELAADPQDSGKLVSAVPGLSPSTVGSYDVSGSTPTVLAQSSSLNCDNESDVAVVPGGADLILACGAPYAHYRYSITDLSQQGSYASTFHPNAVAIAANGDVAAGTSNGVSTNPDLYVYAPNGDTPLNTYNFIAKGANIAARGLAWSADASKLFVVLNSGGSAFSLHVIDSPTLKPAALTMNAGRSTVGYKSIVHVTAHLGTTHTNRTVSIYAETLGSSHRTLLKTARVDSHGNLTVRYVALHSTRFSAVFAGDSQSGPATVTRQVFVFAKVTTTLRGYYGSRHVGRITYRLYHRGARIKIAVGVDPNKHGQCVVLQIEAHVRGAWHGPVSTRCAQLSPTSHVGFYLTTSRAPLNVAFRVRAVYVRTNRDISNLSTAGNWQYFLLER
jgi:hypothetical protein